MAKKTKKASTEAAPAIQLYKVLTADGHSPYITAYAWSLPTDNGDGTWTPGAWHEEPASVLDKGRGLHITPSPRTYWPRATCVAYECEASGYRENPEENSHVVATRVRLLRPIDRDAAMDVSIKWDAEQNVRYEKAQQKRLLDRAREAAAAKKATVEAGRKAGVASPAMLAFETLVELTPTESWRDVNSCRYEALNYVTKYLRFDPGDVEAICGQYRGGYWFGENAAENLYGDAIRAENASACAAFEQFLGRKPWWTTDNDGKRKRLSLGERIEWRGAECKITSFNGDESFVACSYKKHALGSDYERKVERRFTITREAWREATAPKKARKAA